MLLTTENINLVMQAKVTMKELLLNLIRFRSLEKKTKHKKKKYTISFRHFYPLKRQVWKDNRKRNILRSQENKKKYVKVMAYNLNLPTNIRKEYFSKLNQYKGSSFIKNRCIFCGQAHSVYKKWKLSRICLREHIMLNSLPGVTKL